MQRAVFWATATLTSVGLLTGGCQVQRTSPEHLAAQEQTQQQTRVLLNEAEDHLENQRHDAALASFGRALQVNPDMTEAHMGIGDIYRSHGYYALAEPAYRRALQTSPRHPEARYYLALSQHRQGRLSEAIPNYLHALNLDPTSQRTHRELAAAYMQSGRVDRALPYAQRAVTLDPQDAPAWANLAAAYSMAGQYNASHSAYMRYGQLRDELPTAVRLGWADTLRALGRHDQARDMLQPLLDAGDSAEAHERLGQLLLDRRDFYDAALSFRAALGIDYENVPALNGLGTALMAMYKAEQRQDRELYHEAMSAWRQSLRLNRNQPRIVDMLYRFSEQR